MNAAELRVAFEEALAGAGSSARASMATGIVLRHGPALLKLLEAAVAWRDLRMDHLMAAVAPTSDTAKLTPEQRLDRARRHMQVSQELTAAIAAVEELP